MSLLSAQNSRDGRHVGVHCAHAATLRGRKFEERSGIFKSPLQKDVNLNLHRHLINAKSCKTFDSSNKNKSLVIACLPQH
mgnify:CR=1 FL=1